MEHSIQLGLGLIGIGRPWGYLNNRSLPCEADVEELLLQSLELGITFFDTAPAYGLSEKRLGRFLSILSSSDRNRITVATKFGECWDYNKGCSYIDHSYESLCETLDNSMLKLGQINILQVHKTTPGVLNSVDLNRALEYAKKIGIPTFGVSVSDYESAIIACNDPRFSFVQFPYNKLRNNLRSVFALVDQKNKEFIVNRPVNMGELLFQHSESENKKDILIEAFSYILKEGKKGVILTGTTSLNHLRENIDAFNIAFSSMI